MVIGREIGSENKKFKVSFRMSVYEGVRACIQVSMSVFVLVSQFGSVCVCERERQSTSE